MPQQQVFLEQKTGDRRIEVLKVVAMGRLLSWSRVPTYCASLSGAERIASSDFARASFTASSLSSLMFLPCEKALPIFPCPVA